MLSVCHLAPAWIQTLHHYPELADHHPPQTLPEISSNATGPEPASRTTSHEFQSYVEACHRRENLPSDGVLRRQKTANLSQKALSGKRLSPRLEQPKEALVTPSPTPNKKVRQSYCEMLGSYQSLIMLVT